MEKPDVLVIGIGIIGCSLAWELARGGLQVTVMDRGASSAARLLLPLLYLSGQEPLAQLSRGAAALYEGWLDELRKEAADVGVRRPGLLS